MFFFVCLFVLFFPMKFSIFTAEKLLCILHRQVIHYENLSMQYTEFFFSAVILEMFTTFLIVAHN